MSRSLVKVSPDKERAESILGMVDTTLEMIEKIDFDKFQSNIVKEYYDVIRELMTAVLLLDGYKTIGEGSHRMLIEYLDASYKQFTGTDILLLDELRVTRNKISYEGFLVKEDYLKTNINDIKLIILKLRHLIKEKLD